jgi:hypothetical protein
MKQQIETRLVASSRRGPAEAVLRALEQVGPLQFAPGELDALLAEVQTMREKDVVFDRHTDE